MKSLLIGFFALTCLGGNALASSVCVVDIGLTLPGSSTKSCDGQKAVVLEGASGYWTSTRSAIFKQMLDSGYKLTTCVVLDVSGLEDLKTQSCIFQKD